jgi:predicted O-methyltransferase YrrM
MKQAMGWQHNPQLGFDYIYEYKHLTDLNARRIRDAEVIGTACRNEQAKIILEIGTGTGKTTALIASNAPDAIVYTVNILSDEISEGGNLVTFAPSQEEIGSYYKEKGITNIKQIFANTAHWEPDFGPVDLAFIDGCHDADFVYNDTRKILNVCRPGSLILWHDFAPPLTTVYTWLANVCQGVERLYSNKLISGPILYLQDSWVGLYRVPDMSK